MRKLFVLIIISLSLLLASACSFLQQDDVDRPKDPVDNTQGNGSSEGDIYYSIFNGKEISQNQNKYKAFGIMIENSAPSRPHSAIGLADIVYETAVETYTITRFMAIFASEHPTKIGPARSARIPFVRMIQEWGLPYAHYGSAATGEGDAKSLIESLNIPIRFDGHQGINNEFYLRDNTRKAPHNAYFNAEEALTKIPELEYEKLFDFDDRTNIQQKDTTTVSLGYSSGNQVKYEYDSGSKNYLRFINDEPMMDAYMDEQISVRNIITLHAPHTTVESAKYVLVDFVGEGKAEYFVNGKYEAGTWKKASYDDKTEFFDSEGNSIVLLPGNTWIQVVHDNVEIIKE